MARFLRRFLRVLLALCLLVNVVVAFQAWRFTHFTEAGGRRLTASIPMTLAEKAEAALMGVPNPRPQNDATPSLPFKTVTLHSDVQLESWWIPAESRPKGSVAMFHGYGSSKSGMLSKATLYHKLGYNVLLTDFRGSGGSEGVQTTIGYKEAADVKACYDYLVRKGEENIYLAGSSLGAAAIMKAMKDYPLKPKALVLECPFGTLYKTVSIRFRMLQVPPKPLAGVLVFWGGLLNGFWGFDHNPEEYAQSITTPTLLLWGERDDRVSREETGAIYNALRGPKLLRTYAEAGHESYVGCCREQWTTDVRQFLNRYR
jgi:hypothetical protein